MSLTPAAYRRWRAGVLARVPGRPAGEGEEPVAEIGLPVRRNVPRSYRRGLEVELDWSPQPSWRVGGNASFSHNRIDEWTQFYDVYDETGAWIDSVPITHTDVDPLLTPEIVLNLGAEWSRRDYRVRPPTR